MLFSKAFLLLLSPSHEHVKVFLSKWTVLKVDLLQDHQIYSLQACMCALFSPEILQAAAAKGLIPQEKESRLDVAGWSHTCRQPSNLPRTDIILTEVSF